MKACLCDTKGCPNAIVGRAGNRGMVRSLDGQLTIQLHCSVDLCDKCIQKMVALNMILEIPPATRGGA